jgi:hypothetical protein
MKHIIVYIMMVMVVVFMVILINKNQEIKSFKLLTVDTYYSYIDSEDSYVYVDFYLNTKKHPMVDENSYQSLSIHNQDETKSMDLLLVEVIEQHQETYLNEMYYKYTFHLEPPLLGYDFSIDECYLKVELLNETSYDLFIGAISFQTVYEDDIKHMDWNSLSGIKLEGSYLSRLKQIEIEYMTLDENIEAISVGPLYDVSYEIKNQKVIIDIPNHMQLFYACPIIITFEDNLVQVINYFVYIKDYEILKQSGQLIYHYALN